MHVNKASVLYNAEHIGPLLCVRLERFVFDIGIEPWLLAQSLTYRVWLHCILPSTKQRGEYHSTSWKKRIMDLSFSALLKSINPPQTLLRALLWVPVLPLWNTAYCKPNLLCQPPSLLLNTLSFPVSAFQCLSP